MRILILILIILLLYFLERISLKDCFRGFSYAIHPEKKCVYPGEEFRMNTVLENDKWMPMLFIKLYEYMPSAINVYKDDRSKAVLNEEYDQDTRVLVQSLYLLPHQKAKRSFQASLDQRGRYLLGKTRVRCGDLFGLRERTEAFAAEEELVVFPKAVPIDVIEPGFGGYLGSLSVRRFIMPDPILTAGFREYSGSEPQKDISWTETLRRNALMVKQYDYTAEQKASVIVDITDGSREEIEACYGIARSIIEYLEQRRIYYGFYTNAEMNPRIKGRAIVPDGIGRVHKESIMETLGRAVHSSFLSTDTLLSRTFGHMDEMRSYIYITPHPEYKEETIRRYERRLNTRIFTIRSADFTAKEDPA